MTILHQRIHRLIPASLLLLLAALCGRASAQPYLEDGETRYTFAQTWVGAAMGWNGQGSTVYQTPEGEMREAAIAPSLLPQLAIGGTHFWGHADFSVSFPLAVLAGGASSSGDLSTSFSTGVETAARYYPWRLEHGAIRPFIGVAWRIAGYTQESGEEAGPTLSLHRFPVLAGASWMGEFGRIDAGVSWSGGMDIRYPVSRTADAPITLPRWGAWIGYNYLMDATAGLGAIPDSLLERAEERRAAMGELNSFAVAAGVSTALTLGGSSYNDRVRPYLGDPPPSIPYPDLGIGYYHYGLDAAVNLSYRPIRQAQEGYGTTQRLQRTVLALEAFKFFGDYHGFTPFAGLSFGREWLHLEEEDRGEMATDAARAVWAPGVVFGWDIRPTRMDWFTLRTNLRYTPALRLDLPEGSTGFNQLEIDFIQMVVYPERLFR